MNYALAVAAYMLLYGVLAVFFLVYSASMPFLMIAVLSLPVLLVAPRVLHRFADGAPLLPQPYRDEGRPTYVVGWLFVFLGNLAFYGSIAVGLLSAAFGPSGVSAGMFGSLAAFPYLLGIVLVEVSFRSWSKRQAGQDWKYWQKPVFYVVGLIVLGHTVATLATR